MSDYENTLREILCSAWPNTDRHYTLEYRKLFGVSGGYVNNKIFCSCGGFGLALKLPLEDRAEMFQAGGKPLKYFPNGHIKKDYVVLTDKMIGDHKKLRRLIEVSVQFSTQAKGDGK